jgi:hypothetical protein
VLEPEVVEVDEVETLEPEVLDVERPPSDSSPTKAVPLQPSFVAATSENAPTKGMIPNETIIDWRTMKPPRGEFAS